MPGLITGSGGGASTAQPNTWAQPQTFPANGIQLGVHRLGFVEEQIDGDTRLVLNVTLADGTVKELVSIRY